MNISPVPATDPALNQLVAEQQAELRGLPGFTGFPLHDVIEYIAAYLDGHPVGCGGIQPLEPGVGEVKRMYVHPRYRGQGLSRLILAALEEHAVERGYHTLRLETGDHLTVANALYSGAGYARERTSAAYAATPASISSWSDA